MRSSALRQDSRCAAFFLLLVCLLFSMSAGVQAQGTPGPASNRFATVWKVAGTITAIDAGSRTRSLAAGDAVWSGERLEAGPRSEALLLTEEQGLVAIRPNSSFVVEDFLAQKRDVGRMALRVLRGSLRIVTGWLASAHREKVLVYGPTATIGVRGTDFEPYVLVKSEAESMKYEPGVYDKVNRGQTVLMTSAGELVVDAGKVGFAVQVDTAQQPHRGMMTLLLPVLLERVPDFYIGGAFEKDIDEFSNGSEERVRKRLDELGATENTSCDPQVAARDWLARLDAAVERRDSNIVLTLFAEDARIEVDARTKEGGSSSNRLSREDFVRSVRASLDGLTDYKQRRESVEVQDIRDGEACRARVRSSVVEQGKISGTAYRTESIEEYLLERRNAGWVAVESKTVQQ